MPKDKKSDLIYKESFSESPFIVLRKFSGREFNFELEIEGTKISLLRHPRDSYINILYLLWKNIGIVQSTEDICSIAGISLWSITGYVCYLNKILSYDWIVVSSKKKSKFGVAGYLLVDLSKVRRTG